MKSEQAERLKEEIRNREQEIKALKQQLEEAEADYKASLSPVDRYLKTSYVRPNTGKK